MGHDPDRLETHARARWGDEYFLRGHVDAEGDEEWVAVHTDERIRDGVPIVVCITGEIEP